MSRQSALSYLSNGLSKLRQLKGKEEGNWKSKNGLKGAQTQTERSWRNNGHRYALSSVYNRAANTVKTKQQQERLISISHGSVG